MRPRRTSPKLPAKPTVKYALKFADLPLADNWQAYRDLSNRRLVDSFGLLRGVVVPEELTDEPLEGLPYVEYFYRWMPKGYSLQRGKK